MTIILRQKPTTKEVYAYFGLTAFRDQVLEKGLVKRIVVYKTHGLPITQKQFDEVFSKYGSKTIGQLLKQAKAHGIPIPDRNMTLLNEALGRRNYLNHDFFADHAGYLTSIETRKVMIDRLCSLMMLFRRADCAAERIYQPMMEEMGIDEERLARLSELSEALGAGSLLSGGCGLARMYLLKQDLSHPVVHPRSAGLCTGNFREV